MILPLPWFNKIESAVFGSSKIKINFLEQLLFEIMFIKILFYVLLNRQKTDRKDDDDYMIIVYIFYPVKFTG